MSLPLEMYREQYGEYAYWYEGVDGQLHKSDSIL